MIDFCALVLKRATAIRISYLAVLISAKRYQIQNLDCNMLSKMRSKYHLSHFYEESPFSTCVFHVPSITNRQCSWEEALCADDARCTVFFLTLICMLIANIV